MSADPGRGLECTGSIREEERAPVQRPTWLLAFGLAPLSAPAAAVPRGER